MKWLQAQKSVGETRPAVAKAKRSAGEKMKTYTFETDLIFLKRKDVIQADDKFEMKKLDVLPELMYIVSTIEKVTGLSRLTKCYKKEPAIVTPIVEKHIKDMCILLKTDPKNCNLRSDKGLEFDHKRLAKLVGKTKHVPMGPHVEAVNRRAQTQLFRCLRQRKSKTIEHALSQSEKLLNQTYNRIHKKTANELVKTTNKKDNLKTFNDSRLDYIAGDKRKPFAVGDHVRILVKEKKAGIGYKSYHNKTWSEKVYLVKRATKKAVPPKFYVKGKWMLKDSLLKTQPRDEESMTLVLEREVKGDIQEKKQEKKHVVKREKEYTEFEIKRKKEVAAGTRMKTRGGRGTRRKILAVARLERKQDKDVIGAKRTEDEEFKKREKIKSVEHKRLEIKKKLAQKLKNAPADIDDWDKRVMVAWLKARKKPTFGGKDTLKRRIQYLLRRQKV
jgi:hypothetical protein